MVTHHLTVLIAGKARPLTIVADHVVTGETKTLFYGQGDQLIAEVPTETIIDHTES
jgi:hypothetical protein